MPLPTLPSRSDTAAIHSLSPHAAPSSMVDAILNNTALPNLHPALVHFPIALFPLALAFDLAALIARRRSLDRVTALLYVLAVLAAWLAAWAGERAAESLTGLTADVEPLIEGHERWAERFVWTATAVTGARLLLAWREAVASGRELSERFGRPQRLGLLPARTLVLAAGLGALALLVGTADRGGSLVYRSGVAVMAVPAPGEAPRPGPAPPGADAAAGPTEGAARLGRTEEGTEADHRRP